MESRPASPSGPVRGVDSPEGFLEETDLDLEDNLLWDYPAMVEGLEARDRAGPHGEPLVCQRAMESGARRQRALNPQAETPF